MEDDDIGEDEFKANTKAKIEEIRDNMVTAIEEARPETDEEPEEVDRLALNVRVPDDILYELLKKKLSGNAERNRGYILDGFPRTYKDAQYCFLKHDQKFDEEGEPIEEEEEELEEGQEKNFDGYIKDTNIFPSSCIVLEGEDAALIKLVRGLPETQIANSHYNAEDMQRRLVAYRKANNSEVADPSVQDFFKQNGLSIFKESVQTEAEEALNAFKIYIERVSLNNHLNSRMKNRTTT